MVTSPGEWYTQMAILFWVGILALLTVLAMRHGNKE